VLSRFGGRALRASCILLCPTTFWGRVEDLVENGLPPVHSDNTRQHAPACCLLIMRTADPSSPSSTSVGEGQDGGRRGGCPTPRVPDSSAPVATSPSLRGVSFPRAPRPYFRRPPAAQASLHPVILHPSSGAGSLGSAPARHGKDLAALAEARKKGTAPWSALRKAMKV